MLTIFFYLVLIISLFGVFYFMIEFVNMYEEDNRFFDYIFDSSFKNLDNDLVDMVLKSRKNLFYLLLFFVLLVLSIECI